MRAGDLSGGANKCIDNAGPEHGLNQSEKDEVNKLMKKDRIRRFQNIKLKLMYRLSSLNSDQREAKAASDAKNTSVNH